MNLWSHRFSQNTNKKLSGFLSFVVRAEILTIFCSYFGRKDDFINTFWILLTFKKASNRGCHNSIHPLDFSRNHGDNKNLVPFRLLYWFMTDLNMSDNLTTIYTLFESENERQKIEPVPKPLPRASRNFPDVKTRNNFFFHNWTLEIIPFIRFGKQMDRT